MQVKGFKTIIAASMMLLSFACTNVSVFLHQPKTFQGLEQVTLNEEGHFVLKWPHNPNSQSEKSYAIYLRASSLPPGSYGSLASIDSEQSSFLLTRFGEVSSTSDMEDYRLLDTVDSDQYTWKETIDPALFYTFVVKNVGPALVGSRMSMFVAKPSLGLVMDPSITYQAATTQMRLSWSSTAGALSYALYSDEAQSTALLTSDLTSVAIDAYLDRYPGLCIRSMRGTLTSAECQPVKTSGSNAYIVAITSLSENGYYQAGSDIFLEVSYSNPVSVSGLPTLPLNNNREALYVSGSGTDKLLFLYTPVPGDDIAFLEVRTGQDLGMDDGAEIKAFGKANITLPLSSDAVTLQGHNLLTIDTIAPTAPASVGFDLALSGNTQFHSSWISSRDENLKKHNIKLCSLNDCTTACSVAVATLDSQIMLTGANGQSYYACVQGEDKAGGISPWIASSDTIRVDTSLPYVEHIESVSTNGYYKVGDTFQLRVVFSEPVILTGGIELSLGLGAPSSKGSYVSGSGSDTFIFSYTVVPGDNSNDLDALNSTALSLTGGGTLKDAAGFDADRTVPTGGSPLSLKSRSALIVDTTAPAAPTSIGFASPITSSTSFNVSFSASVENNLLTHHIKLCEVNDCATSCSIPVDSLTSPVAVTGDNNKTYYACVQGEDRVGLSSAFARSIGTIQIDTSFATVTSVSSSKADGSYKAGEAITVSVNFSKAVTLGAGTTVSLLMGNGGAGRTATYASGSGTSTLHFTYAVASGDLSTNLDVQSTSALSLSAAGSLHDAAGNEAILTLPALGSAASMAHMKSRIIDAVNPTLPTNIAFSSPAELINPSRAVQWTNSTDTSSLTHLIKLCATNSCTSCLAEDTSASSPKTMTANAGTSVYACVRAEDALGNTSAWGVSAAAATIDPSPTFGGVSAAEVLGTWPDGSAKIKLTFSAPPTGHITGFKVFLAPSSVIGDFNLASPLATVTRGDATYDVDPNDNEMIIAASAALVSDGYYLVRYVDSGLYFPDTNTALSPLTLVFKDQPGYKLIPKVFTGLSYDYYLMEYEASLSAAGLNPGGDSVTSNEASLASCAYKLQQDGTATDPSCGTKAITKLAQSVKSVPPQTSISWDTAFFACRNATTANTRIRLPTAEEWRRASQWFGTSYSAMWSTYSSGTANNCNVSNTVAVSTGSSSLCKAGSGVMDLAGNAREWVDSRVARYSISGAGETRFGYGPTVARSISNGLDNIVQRLHYFDPGVSGRALTMGADYTTPGYALQKQFGVDVQNWSPPATTLPEIGFRCMGVRTDNAPTMAQFSLPDEPKFTSADLPVGDPANWKIPENLYVQDNRWETVKITVNGNTTDALAEGTISLTWKPWSKSSCTAAGVCSSSDVGLSYKIYRFVEANRLSIRTSTPWALGGAGSAYAGDKPLAPLAVNSSGSRLYTNATTDGKLIASITNCDAGNPLNCTFTDSTGAGTGFVVNELYNYILVVEDAAGNSIVPSIQRYRSPYFVGPPPNASSVPFRLEPRFRRASVFLVDEYYQQAQSQPQIMVHVPMNLSGLDHDYYIHKYETSFYSGNAYNYDPPGSEYWPLQGTTADWKADAGICHDVVLRTGVIDPVGCGNGTLVNASTHKVQSKRGTYPLTYVVPGSLWKGCRNTTLSSGSGFAYPLLLSTDSEWTKAADWGDVDADGTIDQGVYTPNLTLGVRALENGAADNTTVRCHTDNNPNGLYQAAAAETANCRSRYGAADMVGNSWEFTSGQHNTARQGRDNGVDGLWYGADMRNAYTNNLGGYLDPFRAYNASTNDRTTVPDTGDSWSYTNGESSALLRGGAHGDGDAAGRWNVYIGNPLWNFYTDMIGRCTL